MKIHRLFIMAILFALVSSCIAGEGNPKRLFNGLDTTGWRLFTTNQNVTVADFCNVTNGVLHLNGKPIGYLRTENSFSNYWLHLQFRWTEDLPRNNSGVFVHVTKSDAIWPDCIQCQVKNGTTGELFGTGSVQFETAPIIKGKHVIQIKENSEKPSGEWNDYDVFVNDKHIETKINGKFGAAGECNASSGSIALQAEGFGIEFREIRIGELPRPMDDSISPKK